MNTKGIICINLDIIPDGWSADQLIAIAKETNYLFYDNYRTRKQGFDSKPYMLDPNEPMDKILIDISSEEGKKIYEEIKVKLNLE